MRSTTANYDTENAAVNKKPVVLISVTDANDDYVSGTFGDIAAEPKLVTRAVSRWAETDLLEGRPSDETHEFSLIDESSTITSDINTNFWSNKNVTIKHGYQSLNQADFTTVANLMELQAGFNVASDLQTYNFTARGVSRLLRGNIARNLPETRLDGAISAGTGITTFNVDSTSSFVDPANLPAYWHPGTTFPLFVKVHNEFWSYDAINSSTQFSGSATSIDRGSFGTDSPGHEDNTTVTQAFNFNDMFPTTALLYILMTTEGGTGHAFYDLASYDSGFQGLGFGLTAAEVDFETIERLGYFLYNPIIWDTPRLILYKETNGLDWITENILKPGGIFLYLNGDGKVSAESVHRIRLDDKFSSVASLTADDIENVNSYEIDYDSLINRIELHGLYNVITEQGGPLTWQDGILAMEFTDSTDNHGAMERPLKMVNPLAGGFESFAGYFWDSGSTNNVTDLDAARSIGHLWFYTFGDPIGKLSFNVTPENWLLQPGDFIDITHANIPDPNAGSRGWTAKPFFITGANFDFLSSPPRYTYTAVTLEALETITERYFLKQSDGTEGFDEVLEANITDKSAAFSATNSITLEAADAYHDITLATISAFWITLRITPPGSANTERWISVAVWLIDTTGPTERASFNYRYIRYNSSDAAFQVELFAAGWTEIVDRFKIDFYDRASADGTTVEFINLKYSDINLTIQEYTP